jgi:hypothetical protein
MNNDDIQYAEYFFLMEEEALKKIKNIREACQKISTKTEAEKMAEYSFNEVTKE